MELSKWNGNLGFLPDPRNLSNDFNQMCIVSEKRSTASAVRHSLPRCFAPTRLPARAEPDGIARSQCAATAYLAARYQALLSLVPTIYFSWQSTTSSFPDVTTSS